MRASYLGGRSPHIFREPNFLRHRRARIVKSEGRIILSKHIAKQARTIATMGKLRERKVADSATV